MAGFAGMRYSELLGHILAAAVERLSIVAKPQQQTGAQVEAAQ
jgi:D-alanine-D-alanine ligase